MNHNGQSATAIGTLEPEWVWAVDEGVWQSNRGTGLGGRTSREYVNRPPTIRMVGDGEVSATVGRSLTLRAFASDDGKPGPQQQSDTGGGGGSASATREPLPNALPTSGGRGGNDPKGQAVVSNADAGATGLAVTWVHYRGPGAVSFEPRVTPLSAAGGEAMTAVSFSEPGTYVVRAYADDRNFTRSVDLTVVVNAASSQPER